MTDHRPTVGRIVHYNAITPDGSRIFPMAAIVTGHAEHQAMPAEAGIFLTIFGIGGPVHPLQDPVKEGEAAGTWCWPPVAPLAQTPR